MMQGMSNKAICRSLGLAETTVKYHVTAILKALQVTNRTEAVLAVGALGWELPSADKREARNVRDTLTVAEDQTPDGVTVTRASKHKDDAGSRSPNTRHLNLPDKPSIAVLPFTNLSGDPTQDYFADGVVEDITIALGRIHWLFVIGSGSAFTYKGRPTDVRQVGLELGVRYVLRGSIRKLDKRVRITARTNTDEALRLLFRAIELDSAYAAPYGLAALCFRAQLATSRQMPDDPRVG